VELGVKFRPSVDGQITGVRFYKGETNIGRHIGHLWTAGGTMLAAATFSDESAGGWQQVIFSEPVPVDASTTYIASYHSPIGRYVASGSYRREPSFQRFVQAVRAGKTLEPSFRRAANIQKVLDMAMASHASQADEAIV
jgi:hypothetical protein